PGALRRRGGGAVEPRRPGRCAATGHVAQPKSGRRALGGTWSLRQTGGRTWTTLHVCPTRWTTAETVIGFVSSGASASTLAQASPGKLIRTRSTPFRSRPLAL